MMNYFKYSLRNFMHFLLLLIIFYNLQFFFPCFTHSPGDDIGQDYKDAMLAGHNFANCNQLFSECPDDFSLLSSISLIEDNLMDFY